MSNFSSSDVATARSTAGEGLDKIESLEQEIIQHIRTSGIRKPRETSLIDEVLEIRRERRKLFSSMTAQISSSENQISFLSEELHHTNEKMTTLINERTEQITNNMKQTQIEQSSLEQRLRDEFKIELEKSKFQDRLKFDKLRGKYEERSQQVEAKLQEIMTEKRKADNQAAKVIAKELLEGAKVELENRYLNKINE